MMPPDCTRTIIIGNGGAGKSWLAAALAELFDRQWTELDAIRWEPGFTGVRRDDDEVIKEVGEIVAGPAWIIEGAYGWLARVAAPRATVLVWLDLPVDQCVQNVESRPRRPGESPADVAETAAWAASYPQRSNGSSRPAHLALFEAHQGDKWQLTDREAMAAFVQAAQAGRV